MRSGIIAITVGLLMKGSLHAQQTELVKYVNTLQGTNSSFELTRGNTYPTTALPFGMHTWTAQTGKNGDGWKYQYSKTKIRGFQQAHQCSSWSNDYGVFSLMPVLGSPETDEEKRATAFSHADEIAKPNYYRVKLANNITTEIAPTERGAHLRFKFPGKQKNFLILDGYTGESEVRILPAERKIIGYVRNGRGLLPNFRSYFVLQFDQPILSYGTWQHGSGKMNIDSVFSNGKGVGSFIRFKDGATVQVKVASSYISPEQAQLNLDRELGSFRNLEQTKEAAAVVWNKQLGRILVEGDSEKDKATFYSCFFRASLFSRQFYEYDKDGKPYYYSPYDGKIHSGYMFTDTGFWDTFRGQFPLNTILYPEMHGRYMQALLNAKQQCGWLPSWSFPGEAGSMIGNHAISLLTDAWVKGIRTFDPVEALSSYQHEANNKGPWGPANGRDGWKEYYQLGYVPYPKYREATAKTLEYAYDDFCGYALAKATNNPFYASVFGRQMFNYKNVYDSSTGFMRGRGSEGKWTTQFDPIEWGGPFTEGNAWHWQWSVFHDIAGLIKLMGGDTKFIAKLDSVFTMPNTYKVGTYGGAIHEMTEMVMANMGQYAHGNQPIQHMIYLYNYAGSPWKTQEHVRRVMERLYDATENGYPGDEDQGQTSSWYVLSAMGFYSVCPGTDQYAIGSPMFKRVTITQENGKKFIISAENNQRNNVYIQDSYLNGERYTANYITHSMITNGGELKFKMGPEPEKTKGLKVEDGPFSISTGSGMEK